MYLAKNHGRFKDDIDWIFEETILDIEQNPNWRIAIITRNKNPSNEEKKLYCCQWFQTGRCLIQEGMTPTEERICLALNYFAGQAM